MSKELNDRTYQGDLIDSLINTVDHVEKVIDADKHAKECELPKGDEEDEIERARR